MTNSYVMESPAEAERLIAQAARDSIRPRLLEAGLRPGTRVLDAGCGPGLISSAIAEIVGPNGEVVGLDQNADRIREALSRTPVELQKQLKFETGEIYNTGLAGSYFDFTWSQFVFEYLREPLRALEELSRVTRSGGVVAVSDVDGAGATNWPMPQELETQLTKFLKILEPSGFDLFIGRKMFSLFRRLGFIDIQVKLYPFYVFPGKVSKPVLNDWETRFIALEKTIAPALGGVDEYRKLTDSYRAMLLDEDTLKYGVVIVTSGKKP